MVVLGGGDPFLSITVLVIEAKQYVRRFLYTKARGAVPSGSERLHANSVTGCGVYTGVEGGGHDGHTSIFPSTRMCSAYAKMES